MVGNERSYYSTTGLSIQSSFSDVILYRAEDPLLYASIRRNASFGQDGWSPVVATNISNDESNINSGLFPDGRVYLINNAVYCPKNETEGCKSLMLESVHAQDKLNTKMLRFRDPLVLATTEDGIRFSNPHAVVSCSRLSKDSTCWCVI